MPEGERRLAAIMLTDMVGYSALTQSKEELAMQVLERHNRNLRPFFSKFNGREIKAIGDSFLVEFVSALDALRCAIEIQTFLHDYNVATSDEWKIKLRIGIHLGDVIHQEGDVFGDAVNIASRIEPIAEPEGICVSEQVFDQVHNKVDLPLLKLGAKELKNIHFSTDVYKVTMPWESNAPDVTYSSNRIAILPFANFSPDPNDAYFADGITEEIISTVSGIGGLSVISRTSVMGYKGTTKRVRDIGKELEVGSVLEGSFRKAGNMIRITTQLIDVASDRHLWAQSYDREFQDVFAIQSDIAKKVAESMKVNLLKDEKAKIEKVPTNNMSAYDRYLRALYLIRKGDTRSYTDSIGYLEDAIKQDPTFSAAYAVLGNVYVSLAGETFPFSQGFEKAGGLVRKALELNESSSDAHLSNGNLALQYHLDLKLARSEFERALELNPSNSTAHEWYSIFFQLTGDADRALTELRKAIELDPLSMKYRRHEVGCFYLKRDYNEAIALSENLVKLEPDTPSLRLELALAYYFGGRLEQAEKELESALQLEMSLSDKLALAQMTALLGRVDEARRLLKETEEVRQTEYYNLPVLSLVYLAMGEKEKALELLEEDFNNSPASFLFNHLVPDFDPLRMEPRFIALERRLKQLSPNN